jgi:hypothetical protein
MMPNTDLAESVEVFAHTPGPWEPMKGSEKGDNMRCAVVAVRGDYRYLVATIENGAPGDFCDTEWENAQLIAAMPKMQEALSCIVMMCAEEIAARGVKQGDEIHTLLAMPMRIAATALRTRKDQP